MNKLFVKRLAWWAILPNVAHPGEDLAYDLYALEDALLSTGLPKAIRTGFAAQAFDGYGKPLGLLIRDRSSMAAKGIVTSGGVIDPGYTGEIKVILTFTIPAGDASGAMVPYSHQVKAGDKIAQMIPIPVLTGIVEEVAELGKSQRGEKGFGSSGS